MTEEWMPVVGYEGLYEVSNHGRVRSLKRNTTSGKILRGSARKNNGYVSLVLFKCGKGQGKLVHRLVAEAFISNPECKPDVNHIDGNKQNNRAENLVWCTPSENQQHSLTIGLRKRSILQNGGSVLITKQVNDRINRIVSETGREKWDVANELLLYALDAYEKGKHHEDTKHKSSGAADFTLRRPGRNQN